MMTEQTDILTVEDLSVAFDTEQGLLHAVEKVDLTLTKGRTLGVVGESGCGKSVTALAIMRLLPKPSGRVTSGRVYLGGQDLLALPAEAMPAIRGKQIAMIFQEPMTSLNPVHRIGKQLGEVYRLHFPDMDDGQIHQASVALLKKIGIPVPERRLKEYPHQISGGMRQRVMIAFALAGQPDILIADEPTTALDVTIQAQILELLKALQQETGMAIMFITHDLGVIAQMCDAVAVMYAGRMAETAPVEELFQAPRHPYTQGLLASIPRLENTRKAKLNTIEGMVPGLGELPRGCRFQNRCPHAMAKCVEQPPPPFKVGLDHFSSCFLHESARGKR